MYSFVVLSKAHVEDKLTMDRINDFKLPFVIISILSPEYNSNEVDIKKGAYCKDHLIVKFHDVNEDGSVNSLKAVTKKINPMSEEHADQILDFVGKWKGEVNNFVIHCEAGMSRSPGTALALSEILNGNRNPKAFVETLYDINFHNAHVKNTILKRYKERLQDK